jgi:hypothetical protein
MLRRTRPRKEVRRSQRNTTTRTSDDNSWNPPPRPGFPFWLPGYDHDYTSNRLCWSVCFFYPFHPERLRQPRKGASSASSGHGKPGSASFQAISYTPLRLLPSTCLLGRRRALSGRQGQRGDPPHLVRSEPMATQPCHLYRLLTFRDPLLRPSPACCRTAPPSGCRSPGS